MDLRALEINSISTKPAKRQTGRPVIRDINDDAQWDSDLEKLQGDEL